MGHAADIILCAKVLRASVDRARAQDLDLRVLQSEQLLTEVNQIQLEAAGFLNKKDTSCHMNSR